jgi:hypothetical protein
MIRRCLPVLTLAIAVAFMTFASEKAWAPNCGGSNCGGFFGKFLQREAAGESNTRTPVHVITGPCTFVYCLAGQQCNPQTGQCEEVVNEQFIADMTDAYASAVKILIPVRGSAAAADSDATLKEFIDSFQAWEIPALRKYPCLNQVTFSASPSQVLGYAANVAAESYVNGISGMSSSLSSFAEAVRGILNPNSPFYPALSCVNSTQPPAASAPPSAQFVNDMTDAFARSLPVLISAHASGDTDYNKIRQKFMDTFQTYSTPIALQKYPCLSRQDITSPMSTLSTLASLISDPMYAYGQVPHTIDVFANNVSSIFDPNSRFYSNFSCVNSQ